MPRGAASLFEPALSKSTLDYRVAKNDQELLQKFGSQRLLIKMNGDFEAASYDSELNWNIVLLEEQFDLAEFRRREIWRLLEDDYRSKSIIFVGVSFRDYSLRRLIAAASKNMPRTRYRHYLLMKAPTHQAEWAMFQFYQKYLKRYSIETLCFRDFGAIDRFVRRVAIVANRPVIGFSGAMTEAGTALPGGVLDSAGIGDLCKSLGRSLAERGFRVTSGHGRVVGIESVEGAFEADPLAARFYLRRRGTSQFSRLAPAVIVSDDSLEEMRARFIPECDLLFAIGGDAAAETGQPLSGTVSEIERARKLGIPVLILKQAGGAAGAYADRYLSQVDASYADKALAQRISSVNGSLHAVLPEELSAYFRSTLPEAIESLVAETFGSFTKQQGARDGLPPW